MIEPVASSGSAIPKVIHQIWLGEAALPDEFEGYRESWQRHHRDWELRLWTEETLPSDLVHGEVYERIRSPVERGDILRFELIARFGGVYADVDVECVGPLDPLIEGTTFFTGRVNRKVLANWLFGATPGHPALRDALERIEPQATFGPYDPTRGTDGPFFTTIVLDRDDVTIFDIGTFFQEGKSVGYAVPESAAAVHHGSRTWARETLDGAVARLDMLERELADAQERLRGYESGAEVKELLAQVRRLETKHAAARAKLTRLQSELAELRAEVDRLRSRRRLRRFASTAKRLLRGT